MKPVIVGICGFAGSGKDTFAAMLAEQLHLLGISSSRMSLADPMKQFCAQVFGFTYEQLWGSSEQRAVPNEHGVTPRRALQTLGTEWGRSLDEDVWVRHLVRRAMARSSCKVVICPDVRFHNEAEVIRLAGGIVVKVVRGEKAKVKGGVEGHASEVEQDSIVATCVVVNDGSLFDLGEKARDVAELVGKNVGK